MEKLYKVASDNNLKNYKIKILNQLLQIYCKDSRLADIEVIMGRVCLLNHQDKYS